MLRVLEFLPSVAWLSFMAMLMIATIVLRVLLWVLRRVLAHLSRASVASPASGHVFRGEGNGT